MSDRAPAALVLALVAMIVFFRPGIAARELDRLTVRLAAEELRLAPLTTARLAAWLAPARPDLELRLAGRLEALGRRDEAAALRGRLRSRWEALSGTFVGADGARSESPPRAEAAEAEADPTAAAGAAWIRPTAAPAMRPGSHTTVPPPPAR